MGEVANRVTGVVANTAGNTIGPVVSALMVTAGIATGHPELAAWAIPGGALAGSLTTEGVALVGQTLNDRARRVGRFAEAAEQAAGRPIEELMADAAENDPLRTLLARTVEVASGSYDAWKIETLARAFAQGAKGGRVDELLLLVGLLADLEAPHARVLRAISDCHGVHNRAKDTGNGRSYTPITDKILCAYDRGITAVLPLLTKQLVDRQLVAGDSGNWTLTPVGSLLTDTLRKLGAMASLARVHAPQSRT